MKRYIEALYVPQRQSFSGFSCDRSAAPLKMFFN
jgi:hypothetical protein